MQNSSTGVKTLMVPVGVKWSRRAKWPSWKTKTSAPNVAERLSTLSSKAFTGTSRLPTIRNRSTKVLTATSASASGRRRPRTALPSTRRAESPPTRTGNGAGVARTAFTSFSPAGENGSTDGTTDSHVPRPAAVKRRDSSLGPRRLKPER